MRPAGPTRPLVLALLMGAACGLNVRGTLDPATIGLPDAGVDAGPSLITSVVRSVPVPVVDLTAAGTLDWVHWGRQIAPLYVDRKLPGERLIGEYDASGPITSRGPSTGLPSTPAFRWEDGVIVDPDAGPGVEDQGTRERLSFVGGVGTAITFNVAMSASLPPDAEQKALFYVGLESGKAQFDVDFDDGSYAEPPRTEQSGAGLDVLFQVTFKRSPLNAKLRARWTLIEAPSAQSALRMHAIAVRQPP